MRRVHQTQFTQRFVLRYWGVVAALLGGSGVLIAATAASTGESPLGALALPWIVGVGVVALLVWRWSAHKLEVTGDAIIERRHPLIWYTRRRTLEEITEVVWCPPERRGLEHGEASLLLRCTRPERDMVIAPANADQFLDDLAAADPTLQRYRGKVVRRAAASRDDAER
jgi:hypothetical protein